MASEVTIVYKGKAYKVVGNPLAHTSLTSNVLKSVRFFGSTMYKVIAADNLDKVYKPRKKSPFIQDKLFDIPTDKQKERENA